VTTYIEPVFNQMTSRVREYGQHGYLCQKMGSNGLILMIVFCLCGVVAFINFNSNMQPISPTERRNDAVVLLASEFSHLYNETIKIAFAEAITQWVNIDKRAAPFLPAQDEKVVLSHGCGNSSTPSPSLLASRDSSGFLEYSDEQWIRMRTVHRAQSLRQRGRESRKGSEFFQYNWEPTLSCASEQRIGLMGDGGKWICDAYRIAEQVECNVISIGSANDWSFEEAVHQLNPRCKIFTFDHTITPINQPAFVNFHNIGIGTSDSGPILTLASALRKIGLEDKTVDIFKIDCEGCERDIFREFLKPDLRQILIELHSADWHVNSFFEEMNSAGYVIFHKEPNTYGCGGDCIEYGFLKLKPGFASLSE
jgi:Methyltransferase domain